MKRLVFEGSATAIALNLVAVRRQRFAIAEVESENLPLAENVGTPDDNPLAECF